MERTELTQPRAPSPACPFARLTVRLAAAWKRTLGMHRPRGIAAGTDTAAARVGAWCRHPEPAAFPYDAVTAELRHAGKHFASRDLLASLATARAALPQCASDAGQRLMRFLSTALDKWDNRYDNPSYLALDGLELPAGAALQAAARRDRLVSLLIADALRFELAAADGRTALQPQMRPDARVTEKRCRHALLVLAPMLARRGTPIVADAQDPVAVARGAMQVVLGGATADEERMLQLTLMPVSRVHDECLFIRVLQSYEATFAYAAIELAAAAAEIARGDGAAAVAALSGAALTLSESSPLFSLIGTMQPEAFLVFRQFTDGASAIQSRNYKFMESVCRTPDRERIDSAAYLSVPEVRAAVLAGGPTIDRALQAGTLSNEQATAVRAAMDRFSSALLKWRRTHHGVAGRMLGDRRGTGDTAGQAYLAQGMTIPVFAPRCPLRQAA
jgi:tryptophan 2,3-dioxygenase